MPVACPEFCCATVSRPARRATWRPMRGHRMAVGSWWLRRRRCIRVIKRHVWCEAMEAGVEREVRVG